MYIWKRKKKVIFNACTNNTTASVHWQLHDLASKEFSSIWWLWFIKILWSEYSVILAHFNWFTFILIRYFHHFISMHVQWILSHNELHLTLNILHIILYISFKKCTLIKTCMWNTTVQTLYSTHKNFQNTN